MAKPNYSHQRKQREQAQRKKKEEKLLRKAEKKNPAVAPPGTDPGPSSSSGPAQ